MSPQVTQLDAAENPDLARRLREVGMLLLECGANGALRREDPTGDWLTDLFCQASIFTGALREAAESWSSSSDPEPAEAFPGCWLSPMPRFDRRRRTGYLVAVIITEAFLGCEQLSAMCHAARQDFETTRRRLAGLGAASYSDVPRLVTMVRYAARDQLQLASVGTALESIGQQLAESYEEMNLLYTTIQSMSVVAQPARFVGIVCEELLATLPYTWIGVQLADDRDRLKKLAGEFIMVGEAGHSAPTLSKSASQLLAKVSPDVPLVLDPVRNPAHAEFRALGRAVLVHPVSRDERVIGVLIAGEKCGPDLEVSSIDMKLLGATATSMAIFLENAALYEDLNAMFLGTLEALTASIDAKDTYTCGHSQRVAHLTQQLARAVGLDEHTVGRMHIAGLVHDVGKIGVPESVLTKPGRLTKQEFALMQKHPEIGHRILKDIPQLRDILPGVLYHHERFDGDGYPEGQVGKRIPMVARLISLADAFDAMSSTRTYRPALSRPAAMKEILDFAGTQFDPEFAPIFVKLDFSEYDRMFAEHQTPEQQASGETEEAA